MKKKIISIVCFLTAAVLLFASCGNSGAEKTGNDADQSSASQVSSGNRTKILFTMEDGKTFTIALYPEYAPTTCENFESLVKSGFYEGTTFHRVIDGFMAQGGGFNTDGSQKRADSIIGEFANNGFAQNTLKHKRGTVSMARTQVPDSASSQFFICYKDCDFLDGNYAAFGEVTDGMDTVDSFLEVERDIDSNGDRSVPLTPIVIKSAEVIS